MAKSLYEQLQLFVEEQTRDIPTVSNLEGIIATTTTSSQEARSQQWWVGQVQADKLLDLNALFTAFTYERPGVEPVDAVSGTTNFPKSGALVPAGKAVFFSGVAKVPNQQNVVIQARAENASLGIYIDGVQVGTGADNLKATTQLTKGDHHVTLIVFGATKPIALSVSPEIEVARAELTPPPPAWVQYPEPELLDPDRGIMIARMAWDNGAQASSWNLYKASTDELGLITNTNPIDNGNGTVTFVLNTLVTLAENDLLFTQYFELGRVVSATGGVSTTTIIVVPSLEADPDLTLWKQLRVFNVLDFVALASIANAGTKFVVYEDDKVKRDSLYLYKMTALSPLTSVESDFSRAAWAWMNDDIPPLGIDWDVGNPPEVIIDYFDITVKYLSPPDDDFAGVRVYGPYPLDMSLDIDPPAAFTPDMAVLTKLGHPLKRDQVKFRVAEDTVDSAFFVATFDQLGNEQPPNTTVIRRNGETATAAYGLVYNGPESTLLETTAIDMSIDLTDLRNDDTTTVVILKVYPKLAVVKAYVDNILLTGSTQVISGRTYPALTVTDSTQDDYMKYEIVLEKVSGKTVQLIVTAHQPLLGPPMRPTTVTYKMDEDPFPGISGIHVEDRKRFPKVFATMDDDASWLRLVNTTSGDSIVMYASKGPGVNDGTHEYNTLLLTWTSLVELDIDQIIPMRIDASKDGAIWLNGVWTGSIQGPSKAASLYMRLQRSAVDDTTMVFDVYVADPDPGPFDITVTATFEGVPAVVSDNNSQSDTLTFPADPITNDLDDTDFVQFTVTRPAITESAGIVTFAATRQGRTPAVQTASIHPAGQYGQPNPSISVEAEATAKGGTGEGMVHLKVTFDENTRALYVYASESDVAGGATPEVTATGLAGIITRHEGIIASDDAWATEFDIATTPSFYRQILVLTEGFSNLKGEPRFFEIRATDIGTAPAAPPDSLGVVMSVVSGFSRATVTFAQHDSAAFHRVFRNGIVLSRLDPGEVILVDDKITPGNTYNYQVQAIRNGQTSAFAASTGPTSSPSPTLQAPTWFAGFPTGGDYRSGDDGFVNIRVLNLDPEAYTDVYMNGSFSDIGVFNLVASLNPGTTDRSLLASELGISVGVTRWFYLKARRLGYTDSVASAHANAAFGS